MFTEYAGGLTPVTSVDTERTGYVPVSSATTLRCNLSVTDLTKVQSARRTGVSVLLQAHGVE